MPFKEIDSATIDSLIQSGREKFGCDQFDKVDEDVKDQFNSLQDHGNSSTDDELLIDVMEDNPDL